MKEKFFFLNALFWLTVYINLNAMGGKLSPACGLGPHRIFTHILDDLSTVLYEHADKSKTSRRVNQTAMQRNLIEFDSCPRFVLIFG